MKSILSSFQIGREDLLPVFNEEDAEVVPHAQGPTVVSIRSYKSSTGN